MEERPHSRSPSPERKRSSSQTGSNPSQNPSASFQSPNPLQRETSGKMKKKFGAITSKEGPQKHHPEYKNQDGKLIDIDSWVMGNEPLASFENFGNRNKTDLIKKVVSKWNCKTTIVSDLLKELSIFFGETDDLSKEDLEMIDYLMALKSNIEDLRISDLDIQTANSFTIKTNPKLKGGGNGDKLNITLTLDWNDILEESRELVKIQMLNDIGSPKKDVILKIVDEAIKNMTKGDTKTPQKESNDFKRVDAAKKVNKFPSSDRLYQNSTNTKDSLQRLYAYGYLNQPAQHGKKEVADELEFSGSTNRDKVILENTTPSFKQPQAHTDKEKVVVPGFDFSKGHIRFILYLEWKAISQLMKLTQVYK